MDNKGPPRLTPRHRQTLQLLAQDLAYKQIAAEMGISMNTVRSNLREIYRRLGVNSRLSAIRLFEKGAWVASGPALNSEHMAT